MSLENIIVAMVVISALVIIFSILSALFFVIWSKKQVARYLKPNPYQLRKDLERLEKQYPFHSKEELAKLVVNKNALFLGLIGALSGLGGVFLALVGIPLDLSVSTLRQMKMVNMIAAIHGNEDLDPDVFEIQCMSLVLGGVGVTKILTRIILKLVGTSIPGIGAIAGFVINWSVTKSIGETAILWNKGESLKGKASVKYQSVKNKLNLNQNKTNALPTLAINNSDELELAKPIQPQDINIQDKH